MSATNQFENDLLDLIFKNVATTNVGDATGLRGSTTPGVFYLSLHTGPLTDTDTAQTVNEATYTGYARVAVARTAGGWTFNGNVIENAAEVLFPQCTGGTNVLTYFGIGYAASGAGYLQLYAELAAPLNVSNGITPRFVPGALTVTMD